MRFLVLILSLVPGIALGQFSLSINAGQGSYNMAEMKSWQNQTATTFPVTPQTTAAFPSYWFYEVNAKWALADHFVVGNALTYGSTGGRVYYGDYSGSIGSDQNLSFVYYSIIIGGYSSFLGDKLRLQYDVRPGITHTKLKLLSYQTQTDGGFTSDSQAVYTAVNLSAQPTLTLTLKLGFFGVNAFAGYNLNIVNGELRTNDQDGTYLVNGQDKTHPDWSGLRAGGGISFYFSKK